MKFDTLNSILQIGFGLMKFNYTCYTYDIPKGVIKKIESKKKYKFILSTAWWHDECTDYMGFGAFTSDNLFRTLSLFEGLSLRTLCNRAP